jgi:hypothetical protein
MFRAIHLAIPVIAFILFSTAMIFIQDTIWAIGLALGIILLVGLLMLKDMIDWRYYKHNPPILEPPVLYFLEKNPFYMQLEADQKRKFEQRLALCMIAHDFQVQPSARSGAEDSTEAQEDLKAICSIPAIILTWPQEDFLIPGVERIVLYQHPFPSPRYKSLHTSESDREDKLLIFSIPHLEKGVMEPFTYFDIGLYEWARISGFQSLPISSWDVFYQTYGIGLAEVQMAIGLEKIDLRAATAVMQIHQSYTSVFSDDSKRID